MSPKINIWGWDNVPPADNRRVWQLYPDRSCRHYLLLRDRQRDAACGFLRPHNPGIARGSQEVSPALSSWRLSNQNGYTRFDLKKTKGLENIEPFKLYNTHDFLGGYFYVSCSFAIASLSSSSTISSIE